MSRRLQRIARLARAYVEAARYAEDCAALEAMQGQETPSLRSSVLADVASLARRDLERALDVEPGTPALSPAHLEIIRHALGHDPARPRSGGYRNGYAADPIPDLVQLAEAGMMERSGNRGWRVTEDGARAAGPSTLAAWRRWKRSR